MKTLVLANQKGGAMKSSLSAHLAVAAAAAGLRVVMVDTDPQETLTDWWDERAAEDVQLVKGVKLSALPAALEALAGDFDLCIIDTPPGISPEVGKVTALGDFVLIPAKPSPNDLRAIPGTLELLARKSTPYGFVITQAIARSSLVTQAMGVLSEHGPVSPVVVANRADYAASMTDGRTAQELDPKGKAAAEIAGVLAWVRGKVGV